jgi:hypothetical protein
MGTFFVLLFWSYVIGMVAFIGWKLITDDCDCVNDGRTTTGWPASHGNGSGGCGRCKRRISADWRSLAELDIIRKPRRETRIGRDELRPRDIVRETITYRVGMSGGLIPFDNSLRYSLVHRPKPKPPVGAVLSGERVKRTWWKAGTSIRLLRNSQQAAEMVDRGLADQVVTPGTLLTLLPNGEWLSDNGIYTGFDLIGDDCLLRLCWRPVEEGDTINIDWEVEASAQH